jgi:hypothetical protein
MDEKLRLDANVPEDRILTDNLLTAKRIAKPQKEGEPCPLHAERESLIWAYADGFLEEAEEGEAWEEISQCRQCLDRFATVQRSLREAETWLKTEPVLKPALVPKSKRILRLFNVEWVEETIQRVGQALAVGELQFAPSMGEEEKNWRGQLSYKWGDLQVTIETTLTLEPEDRSHSMKVAIILQDQAKQFISRTQVDFCDIQGVVMETGVTDDKGHVSFSSQEGRRFVGDGEPQAEIGFCLELTKGDERAIWQIVAAQETLGLGTMMD